MLAAGGAVGGVHVSDGLHSRLRRRMDAYPDDDDEGGDEPSASRSRRGASLRRVGSTRSRRLRAYEAV